MMPLKRSIYEPDINKIKILDQLSLLMIPIFKFYDLQNGAPDQKDFFAKWALRALEQSYESKF